MNRATQQILIAVDGSEPSTWALDVGGRLAVEREPAIPREDRPDRLPRDKL